jgi:hypothetical protein
VKYAASINMDKKKKKEASIRLKKKVTKGLIENINYAKI